MKKIKKANKTKHLIAGMPAKKFNLVADKAIKKLEDMSDQELKELLDGNTTLNMTQKFE